MPKEQKAAQVNIRLTPTLKALAEQAAEAEQRSLTSFIEWLLTTYLRKKRYLPTEQPNAPASASTKPARKTPKA